MDKRLLGFIPIFVISALSLLCHVSISSPTQPSASPVPPAHTASCAPAIINPSYSHHHFTSRDPGRFSSSIQRSIMGQVAMYWPYLSAAAFSASTTSSTLTPDASSTSYPLRWSSLLPPNYNLLLSSNISTSSQRGRSFNPGPC